MEKTLTPRTSCRRLLLRAAQKEEEDTTHTGKRNRCKDVPELFLVIPRKKKLKDVEKPGVEENCVFEGHYRYQKFVKNTVSVQQYK